MIERSFDRQLLKEATEELRYMVPEEVLDIWWENPNHLMFVEDDNVGLATFEYPGVYTVHWYFKVRGRKAIDLAKRMLTNLFENYGAKTVRGLVKQDLKASRWASRQVGMKSFGILEFADGLSELFITTKEDFLKENVHG